MEKQKYDEAQVDKLHSEIINHQTDISNHKSLMEPKMAAVDAARKSGYKTPAERLEEERARNQAEKKKRQDEAKAES